MPEVKQEVRPIEVSYVCDSCGKGLMAAIGEMDAETGDVEHSCRICNHQQTFQWRTYPHIEYVETGNS